MKWQEFLQATKYKRMEPNYTQLQYFGKTDRFSRCEELSVKSKQTTTTKKTQEILYVLRPSEKRNCQYIP